MKFYKTIVYEMPKETDTRTPPLETICLLDQLYELGYKKKKFGGPNDVIIVCEETKEVIICNKEVFPKIRLKGAAISVISYANFTNEVTKLISTLPKNEKWITDRLPTKEDADFLGRVIVFDSINEQVLHLLWHDAKSRPGISHWKPSNLEKPEPPVSSERLKFCKEVEKAAAEIFEKASSLHSMFNQRSKMMASQEKFDAAKEAYIKKLMNSEE